jgi:hypothetical protein
VVQGRILEHQVAFHVKLVIPAIMEYKQLVLQVATVLMEYNEYVLLEPIQVQVRLMLQR